MSDLVASDGSTSVNDTPNAGPATTPTIGAGSTAADTPNNVTKSSSSAPKPNSVSTQQNVEKKSMETVHNDPAETVFAPSPTSPTSLTSVSSTQQQQQQLQAASTSSACSSPPEIPIPTPLDTNHAPATINVNTENLLMELKQKKELARRLDEELYYLCHFNQELSEKEQKIQDRMLMRQKDQKQLLDNYNDHIRARRATEDDPSTIHNKLHELKAMIKSVSISLTKQCDCSTATKAMLSFWVNLHEAIQNMGDPLPVNRIQMLTEKFLMDVLVQNMNYSSFTGLKISQHYTQLQMWFEKYEPSFCTRLRQDIAKVVVLSDKDATSDTHLEIQKLNERMFNSLYVSLLKAFPFIKQHDLQETDPSNQYSAKLRAMVDFASGIGHAMRGQEVDIAAAAVGEGSEMFDPKTMVDEDGQTAGIVNLCINPPFIAYSNRIEVLEKARVLCRAPMNTDPTPTTTAASATATATTAAIPTATTSTS
ncbi:hypothetical protein BD408DRAFT_146447 [Parasitella parasitica]|nr:hypothetical protein BD408DRAFT_146447 [Parasitella parasitica]